MIWLNSNISSTWECYLQEEDRPDGSNDLVEQVNFFCIELRCVSLMSSFSEM